MNRKEMEQYREFTRITIGQLAKKTVVRLEGGQKTVEMLAMNGAYRKLVNWGYRMCVNNKEVEPIENCPNKRAYWEEAKKWDLTHEERIELAKGIYYLTSI
jgi:hypothetical protein